MRNWIGSALDRDYWKLIVNAALVLRVPLAMQLVRYQYEKLDRFGSGQGLLETHCECSIDPPGTISHAVG